MKKIKTKTTKSTKTNPEKLTKVRIDVTERLIKTGTVNDSSDCPFARALRKVLASNVTVTAHYEDIVISLPYEPGADDDYFYQDIPTPDKVAKFMEKIDGRDPFDIPDDFDAEGELLPKKLPPAPKPFSINLKIKNKFLRPGLRT